MQSICSDLLVVELASVLAGPAVGMFFAEMGARVVKVEHPGKGGDITRKWKLPAESPDGDVSAYFSSVNWGKQSLGVDLSRPEGQEIVYDLLRKADIVLLSFKPGDDKRFGMEAERLRALNPRLIAAELTAYGPGDSRTGFDAIIQAETGFTFMNGEPDGPPVKMPVALIDVLAAHQLKEGLLLALWQRERSGQGDIVRSSLTASGLSSLVNQSANYLVAGHVPQRMGSAHPNIVPYGSIYHSADGLPLVLAVGNDRQFAGLCEALGISAVAEKAEFAGNESRVQHRAELEAILKDAISKVDRAPLLQALADRKVPAGAVNDMAAAMQQPEARALMLSAGDMRGMRTAAFSREGDSARPLTAPPRLGADTDAVLSELLGYDAPRIAALRTSGVIGGEQ